MFNGIVRSFHKRVLKKLPLEKLIRLCKILSVVGFISIFYIPYGTKYIYQDENALGIGSVGQLSFSLKQRRETKEIMKVFNASDEVNGVRNIPFTFLKMEELYQQIGMPVWRSDPKEGEENDEFVEDTRALITVLRAPKGNGKESILYVVPVTDELPLEVTRHNLAFMYALISQFSKELVKRLNLDVWIMFKYIPNNEEEEDFYRDEKYFLDSFFFDTILREVLILDFTETPVAIFDYLSIEHVGWNGDLPNLDVMVTVTRAAFKRRSFVFPFYPPTEILLDSETKTEYDKNNILQYVIDPTDVSNRKIRIFNFFRHLWYLALSVPRGSHGLFRELNINAVTLKTGSFKIFKSEKERIDHILEMVTSDTISGENFKKAETLGKILETVTRCFNNLIESLHHSYDLYFLDSSYYFIAFDEYSVVMWLNLAPLLIGTILNFSQVLTMVKRRKYQTKRGIEYPFGLILACAILLILLGGYVLSLPWILERVKDIFSISICDKLKDLWILWMINALFSITFFWVVLRRIILRFASTVQDRGDRELFLKSVVTVARLLLFSVMVGMVAYNPALFFFTVIYILVLDRISIFRKRLGALGRPVALITCPLIIAIFVGYWFWNDLSELKIGLDEVHTNSMYVTLCVLCYPIWMASVLE